MRHSTTIGILTGGASRRMGQPKALLLADGVSLIERIASLAESVCDQVVLLGQPPFALPQALTRLAVLQDIHPGAGPIAGLEALLLARPMDRCILLACDMPCLSSALLERLISTPADADALVCRTLNPEPQWHPCCAAYNPTCRAAVHSAISSKRFGMHHLLSNLSVWPIDLIDGEADWVRNWNEPGDLDADQNVSRDA